MRIPEKRFCDLCKVELTGPHVRMAYPLDQADRDRILKEIPPPPKSIFGFMVAVTAPDSWSFEFCRGCVDGFLPMLSELKSTVIQQLLEERRRRAEAPIGEEERES